MSIVHVAHIIGTDTRVVTAWEPLAGHTSIRFDADKRLGQITSRPLPEHIEAMPGGSPERMSAAIDFHAANVLDALAAIEKRFPGLAELEGVVVDGGCIVLQADPAELVR